ncbi:MAG: hypothetical protein QM783_12475 [Phycisphaerales bacterium]
MNRALIASAVVSTLADASFGQATFVSQSRSVNPAGVSSPAPGFGPYSASGSYTNEGGSGASAGQTSDLTITGATFDMGATGNGGGNAGSSILVFSFTVLPGTTYTLVANGFQDGGPGSYGFGTTSVTFTGPGVNDQSVIAGFNYMSLNTSGTLSGGLYTLTVEVHGYGNHLQSRDWPGTANANGALTLVPTPTVAAALGLSGFATLRRRRR